MVAEACAELRAGCRERALDGGDVALDFWLAPGRRPGAERLAGRLAARGLPVALEWEEERADWEGAVRAFHRPVEVAGLLVRPPWTPPQPGLLDVVIDPGMAFGTGQHATTRGCLELLAALPPGPLVDVGTGSGVLAIAARRLGHDPVWALDADPLAVDATIRNARANGVGLRVARRTLGRDPLPAAPAVMGNLTSGLLVTLAEALFARPPERAVLSGLRPAEADRVLAAWAELGLGEIDRREEDDWAALLVAREAGAA